MNKNWSLEAHDGFTIHGLFTPAQTGNNGKALLIVHGMTGSPLEEQHVAAAKYFSALGYNIIQPYLYCMNRDKKNCRTFQDAKLSLHAQDINTVMQHFGQNFTTFYAAGHSYGGPSILMADTTPFKAICLWDPTFKQKPGLSSTFEQNEKGDYVIEWDHTVKVGQAFMDEYAQLDRSTCIAIAKKSPAPIRVIWAGDGEYITRGESYHNFGKPPSDAKIVPDTEHCFIEPGTTELLLKYTQEWFEKLQP